MSLKKIIQMTGKGSQLYLIMCRNKCSKWTITNVTLVITAMWQHENHYNKVLNGSMVYSMKSNNKEVLAVNYFCKMFHLICVTRSWKHLCTDRIAHDKLFLLFFKGFSIKELKKVCVLILTKRMPSVNKLDSFKRKPSLALSISIQFLST